MQSIGTKIDTGPLHTEGIYLHVHTYIQIPSLQQVYPTPTTVTMYNLRFILYI